MNQVTATVETVRLADLLGDLPGDVAWAAERTATYFAVVAAVAQTAAPIGHSDGVLGDSKDNDKNDINLIASSI